MKAKIFNVRIIIGIILIFFAIFQISVTTFYKPFTGFDYSSLFLILIFLIIGIMQFFDRKKPIVKGSKSIFWVVFFILFTVSFLIYSKYNQNRQVKKMYEFEKSRTTQLSK